MLFKKPGQRFGMDLASFNMQRGREFGLPGYMEFRLALILLYVIYVYIRQIFFNY
jgi:hypothetical protein